MPASDIPSTGGCTSTSAITRGRSPVTRALLALGLACALLALPAASALAASKQSQLPSETLVVFHKQLDSGQVHEVVFHPKVNTMHVFLTDGHKAVVTYAASERQHLAEEIGPHHVTVSVVEHKAAHKLRYIVGGVVIVVIVVVVGILLYMRRRKQREEEEEAPRARKPGTGAR